MLDKREQSTVMLKLKFIRNRATLDVTSNTSETVIFDPKRNDRHIRFEIIGLLQDKTRCPTAKLE